MTKLRNKPLFGLDLATTSVKAVELDRRGRSYRLRGYAIEPLPPEMAGGEADRTTATAAITRARKRLRTRRREVAASVSGAAVITKKIAIPAGLDELQQQAQVELEASHHLPAGIESMFLDYQILGPYSEDPENLVEALLVACKREVVEGHLRTLEAAGLKASVIDVAPFAVENAFERYAPANYFEQTVGLFDIGEHMTNINILHRGQSIMMRDHYFGGHQLTESLAGSYGWTPQDARQKLMQGELSADSQETVVAPFLTNLVTEIGRSLDFYTTNHPRHPIDWVVLSGGCALLPGIVEATRDQLGIEAVVADPFTGMRFASQVSHTPSKTVGPRLMVATGLALRNFDP